MFQTEPRLQLALLLLSSLLASSCEKTTEVGSACRDGVCPQAKLSLQPCLVSSSSAEISVVLAADEPEHNLGSICLPGELPQDAQGRVDCRVVWELGFVPEEPFTDAHGQPLEVAPPLESCSGLPFVESATDDETCVITQLTAAEVAAGDVDGWFYDNEVAEDCPPGIPAVRFTDGAAPQTGVTVKLSCATRRSVGSDATVLAEANECPSLPEQDEVEDLGEACMPSDIPDTGFDDRVAYLEVGSNQCESEACLVYRLRGTLDCGEDAGQHCAPPEEVHNRVYCSCRCDGPTGDPGPYCDCAEGFTCLEVLPTGDPAAGSYCVRDGTFTRQ